MAYVGLGLGVALSRPNSGEDEHFPNLPELPNTRSGGDEQFVLLVDEDFRRKEEDLIKNDQVGDSLNEKDDEAFPDDELSAIEDEDEDPTLGEHFEGDITGVQISAVGNAEGKVRVMFHSAPLR